MSAKYVHVVTTIDVEKQSLSIRFVDSDLAAPQGSEDWFKVVELPMRDVFSAGHEKAAGLIGKTSVSVIARLIPESAPGSASDALQERSTLDATLHELRTAASKGDPSMMNALAIALLEGSVELRDIALLDEAEAFLRQASDRGYEPAMRFLNTTWASTRENARRRIERGKPSS